MDNKKKFAKIRKNKAGEKENDTFKRISRMMRILHTLDSGKTVSCRGRLRLTAKPPPATAA